MTLILRRDSQRTTSYSNIEGIYFSPGVKLNVMVADQLYLLRDIHDISTSVFYCNTAFDSALT